MTKLDLHRRIKEVVKIGPYGEGAPSKKPLRVRKQVWLEPCVVRASHRG